jgi:hypothetical protein
MTFLCRIHRTAVCGHRKVRKTVRSLIKSEVEVIVSVRGHIQESGVHLHSGFSTAPGGDQVGNITLRPLNLREVARDSSEYFWSLGEPRSLSGHFGGEKNRPLLYWFELRVNLHAP